MILPRFELVACTLVASWLVVLLIGAAIVVGEWLRQQFQSPR